LLLPKNQNDGLAIEIEHASLNSPSLDYRKEVAENHLILSDKKSTSFPIIPQVSSEQ